MTGEVAEIENVEPSFGSYEFTYSSFDVTVKYEVLKMNDSTYIWIGNSENPTLSDMSYGIRSPYAVHPISTKILGTASVESSSDTMAERLTKKLKKPVYISFCLPVTSIKLQEKVEKRLQEEIELHWEMF